MANTEDKKLAIDVIARIDKLEKGMAKAKSTVEKNTAGMEKATTRATKAMESSFASLSTKATSALSGWGKGMLAAGISALALGAIVDKTKQALDEFGNIADKSGQAGVDSEFFQALAYQASLAGVGVDELSGSLNAFNKNAGLAVVAKGKMVASLQKLNPALLENIRNAKSQEERVRLAAEAIDKAKTASEKAALATTMFGDAGTKLVSVFNGGAAAINSTANEASRLGIIIDRDLIARADELGDDFETATKAIDTQFKVALIELAPILVDTAKLAADVARAIAGLVDSWRELDQQTTRGLNTQLATIGKEKLDLENRILETMGSQRESDLSLMDQAVVGGLKNEIAVLKEKEKAILDITTARDEAAAAEKKITGGKPGGDIGDSVLPPVTKGGGSTRNKAAEDAIRQATAVKDLIADLQFEQSTVGKSQTEIAKMTALRTAGAAATDEQRAQIVKLINETAAEKARVEALAETMSDAKSQAASFMTTFRQGMVAGEGAAKSFQSAMLGMLDSIATKIEQMAADKLVTGLLGGVLGGSTGGLGGVIGSGSSYFPPAPSAAAPVAKMASAPSLPSMSKMAGAGQQVHVTVGLIKNGLNIEPEVVDVASRVGRAGLAAHRRGTQQADIIKTTNNPRRRG